MSVFARLSAILSISLLVALMAAGCGGADESESASSDAPTEPAAADGSADADADADGSDGDYEGDPPPLVKAWVDAIESCATINVDGTYKGCLDRASLIEFEPSLEDAPGTVTMKPVDDSGSSYELVVKHEDATFTYTARSDGTITQTCVPRNVPVCAAGQ